MTGSTLNLPKKFYKLASHAPDGERHVVLLDQRKLRTPAKAVFAVPSAALAAKIAAEWNAQEEHIDPSAMPLSRLANVAIDRMAQTREATIAEIVKYANADLLLVRAEEPDILVAAEEAAWNPILDWAAETFDAAFVPTNGLVIHDQNPAALDSIAAHAAALDDFRLTAMAHLGALFGSSLLAFAVLKGRLTALEAYAASRVDENFQEAKWGVDDEAAERTARLEQDVQTAARFLSALDL